jgi:hypothetical protein
VCGNKKSEGMLEEAMFWITELGRNDIKKKFVE